MADKISELQEYVYENRDYKAKQWVVNELSDFLLNFAESSLETAPLGAIDKTIDDQMPGLLAEFAGFLMVGLCNLRDGPESGTIQARFHEMFVSGMCEAPVILRFDKRTPKTEPFGSAYYQTFQDLRKLVKHTAPSGGPTWFIDLMASIEIAIDELAESHKFLG